MAETILSRLMLLAALILLNIHCALAQQQSSSICELTEQSIFADCETNSPSTAGTMRAQDLTVQGFSIGTTTLDDVVAHFPKATKFRLTKEEESPVGICLANTEGYAIVLAAGYAGAWRVLDTIYIAPTQTFRILGAHCFIARTLPAQFASTSGIGPGIGTAKLRSLLPDIKIEQGHFEVAYSTSPSKAPWVSAAIKPKNAAGWKATSGAIGAVAKNRVRWLILYGAVSD